MDKISIKGLEFYGYHGVFAEENRKGQTFIVDCELYFDFSECEKEDDFTKTVDYGGVCNFIIDYLGKNVFKLIETASKRCVDALMIKYPLIEKIEFTLYKPEAPLALPFTNISVTTVRERKDVYLSIGSNLGDKAATLNSAIDMLKADPKINVVKLSNFIVTKPYGGVEQDDFLNGAIKLRTFYTACELLDKLHEIENKHGRTREVRWGARTLDLDIVFFGEDIISTDDLIIPHIDMQNRAFVLEPLSDIAPNYRHPILKKTVLELLDALKKD